MHFYTGDAALVVKPGLNASGKAQIPKAFAAIADFLKHKITVWQGEMKVIEGPDTALVIMETVLNAVDADGAETSVVRRASQDGPKPPAHPDDLEGQQWVGSGPQLGDCC